jgi:hypothetical protein
LVVAWDTSTDSTGGPDQSVLGHVIYAGPSTRSYNRTYTQSVTPPIINTYQYGVTNLGLGTYYLTVTAYNSTGESAYANEVACNFTACDTPCIVVAQMQKSERLQKLMAPSLTLFTEKQLEKEKPKLFEEVKQQISDAKVSEAHRLTLKDEDLPPGNLTINVPGFEKDWEPNEKK